jgi:hypothetical protein
MRKSAIHGRSGLLVASVLVLALGAIGARCPLTLYVLEEDSAWIEGCIEGRCLCPVSQAPLVGSFRLERLPSLEPGPARPFEVSSIRWRIGTGEDAPQVTGSGLYTTSAPLLDEQQLVLDLEIDGVPLERIDSGVVAGGLAFPRIEIQGLTLGACYQSGVVLQAAPVGR